MRELAAANSPPDNSPNTKLTLISKKRWPIIINSRQKYKSYSNFDKMSPIIKITNKLLIQG